MRWRTGAIMIAAVLAVAGVAWARPVRIGRFVELPYGVRADHPHPTYASDARRTGRSAARAPQQAPSRIWVAEPSLPGATPAEPIVTADGVVLVGTASGVMAYDGRNGRFRWQTRLGNVEAPPSVTPLGELAVSAGGGGLFLLGASGDIRTRGAEEARAQYAPLVLDDGSIVVGGRGPSLHRLDPDGRVLFAAYLGEPPTRAAAWSARGRIVVASGDRVVFVGIDGTVESTLALGAAPLTPPAVGDDGTVWIATREPALIGIAPDGTIRSRTELPGQPAVLGRLAIGLDGGVRVSIAEQKLVCVGPTGVERWRYDTGGATIETAVALDVDDTALLATADGVLRAVSADGTEMWRVLIGPRAKATPVLAADGTILLVTASTTRGGTSDSERVAVVRAGE